MAYDQRRVLVEMIANQSGIGYLHVLDFAPSDSLLARYKLESSAIDDKEKWPDFEARFSREINNTESKAAFRNIITRYRAPCFIVPRSSPPAAIGRVLVKRMSQWLNLERWQIKHL